MLSLAVLFILLLGCSAFFSGSETALFSLSEVRVRSRRRMGSRTRQALLAFLESPRDMLVTILFGNQLVNISISKTYLYLLSKHMICLPMTYM